MATPVGESSWLAYIDEALRTAIDFEQRVDALERYKRAIDAEPESLRLWLAYCKYFWSLWSDSQSDSAGWSEEEQMVGSELFPLEAALDLWQQGYEAVKYRLGDGHLFWDEWLQLELELLSKETTPDRIQHVSQLFIDRLSTPHLTWDETSQKFSSFLSEFDPNAWEESMKKVTSGAQEVKKIVGDREFHEVKLKQAIRIDDKQAEAAALSAYLGWEIGQSLRNKEEPEFAAKICLGLFARALSGILATDESTWCDYVVYLSSSRSESRNATELLHVYRRAVQHCPWSGQLWKRWLLCAAEGQSGLEEVESIKTSALDQEELFKDGMEAAIQVLMAWCGYLKKIPIQNTSPVEEIDPRLKQAVQEGTSIGKCLYGTEFQGDPNFRLERIYIQFLTENKDATQQARSLWKKLSRNQTYADSYEFWTQYYAWEMRVFSMGLRSNVNTSSLSTSESRYPKAATAVLERATSQKTLDWPEKLLELYETHCIEFEEPSALRKAVDTSHKIGKIVKKRREREEHEKQAAYAAYYEAQGAAQPTQPANGEAPSPSSTKRKRDAQQDGKEVAEKDAKRHKSDDEGSAQPLPESTSIEAQSDAKRDRENATVLVRNLPAEATQTKVRQYFKEYGHINNITAFVENEDGQSTTALIEFRSAEDAQSALLRDGRYFGESQIQVQSGHNLTVYVANFPPTADDAYIRNLFKKCGKILSIRWPSLKINTRRRFCYVSFEETEGSAKAVQKDGVKLEDQYGLVAKYSDPAQKKNREGAVAEGREVHVSNLDRFATEAEVRGVFTKYGKVTRINLPVNIAGKGRGFAFLDFETKEMAKAAASNLDNVKLRTQIMKVEISKDIKVKTSAKAITGDRKSASPAPSSHDAEGDQTMGDADANGSSTGPSTAEIAARTIALLGLPDTVNDARVLALVEPVGEIVKLIVLPAKGGARIEFIDAATAGKATLQLDGMVFGDHKLHVGSLEELRHAKANRSEDQAAYADKSKAETSAGSSSSAPAGKGLMLPPPTVRRPVTKKRPGPKKPVGFAPRTPATSASAGGAPSQEKTAPKSNADFKAMFLAGKEKSEEKPE